MPPQRLKFNNVKEMSSLAPDVVSSCYISFRHLFVKDWRGGGGGGLR